MTRATARSRNGFTLVEVLISGAIFLVIMLAMYQLYTSSQATYAGGTRKANVQQNARLAMEEMVRDLRMAGYSPETQAVNAQPVRVGTATGIAVIGAWGSDAASRIRVYCYEPGPASDPTRGVLRRREGGDPDIAATYAACPGTGEVIARDVTGFLLTYYGAGNVLLPAPLDTPTLSGTGTLPAGVTTERDALRTVLVTMTFQENVPQQDQASDRAQTYTLTSTIRLRNLGN